MQGVGAILDLQPRSVASLFAFRGRCNTAYRRCGAAKMLGNKDKVAYGVVPTEDEEAQLDAAAGEVDIPDKAAAGGATSRAIAVAASSGTAADGATAPAAPLSSGAGAAPAAPATGAAAPAAAAAAAPASGTPYPAIGFWILMSCSVILFNKYLYNGLFPYPVSLTCIHMLFVSCSTWSLRLLGYIDSPKFGWNIWGRNVLPIGILYALSLATSNLGAARLTVSFVQMIKALTPLVALGVSVLLKVEKSDKRQSLIVAVMCAGVIVASYGEILWDTVGVFFQVTSVAAEGSRLVITQVCICVCVHVRYVPVHVCMPACVRMAGCVCDPSAPFPPLNLDTS